jgi:hypothetical protein
MKKTLKETIKEFKRLTTEATSTASSGAYEQPLGYTPKHVCTPACPTPCPGQPQLVGSEIAPDAPTVDVVDVTVDSSPVPEGWDEIPFEYDFSNMEAESMGNYFDEGEIEDEDGVFTNLQMFTETTKGIGW